MSSHSHGVLFYILVFINLFRKIDSVTQYIVHTRYQAMLKEQKKESKPGILLSEMENMDETVLGMTGLNVILYTQQKG